MMRIWADPAAARNGSAWQGTDPSQQLDSGKQFDQVVIRYGIEPFSTITNGITGKYHAG